MAYSLSNKFAKNCCKRTVLVQLIVQDVGTCFFLTTVYIMCTVIRNYMFSNILTVCNIEIDFSFAQPYSADWS